MNTIVVGSLNTDLIAKGLKKFPKVGEHVTGSELVVGPGGKSRNIASMVSQLSGANSVAMIGRTVKDAYGLWRVPVDALQRDGVNIDHIVFSGSNDNGKLPGIAFIPLDAAGNNQIFVLPGASSDFSAEDLEAASDAFDEAAKEGGILIITSECPFDTAQHAVKMAAARKMRVLYDPGGIDEDSDVSGILGAKPYLIKPNEHETKHLTGVVVTDLDSAKQAARKLQKQGASNVLITVGGGGAYLITPEEALHIPIPEVYVESEHRDETGCGDQTIAALCAALHAGKNLKRAAEKAIMAGTLQFYRLGIDPLDAQDIDLSA